MRIFAAARADLRRHCKPLVVPDLIRGDDVFGGQRGFTLVELMMVLAVMALAASVVMLTLPSPGDRVQDEADRLAARIAALRDLAIVEGRPMAVSIRASGYDFERRTAAGWEALPGRGFGGHDWPDGVGLAGDAAPQRRIGFDPVGMTAARQTLVLTDGETVARLSVSATGEVARDE